jgi:hypothetical protein
MFAMVKYRQPKDLNSNMFNMTEEIKPRPCAEFHGINGHMPQTTELHYAGQTCDCGKFLYKAVGCGCPNNPHEDLKMVPNPNYNGQ